MNQKTSTLSVSVHHDGSTRYVIHPNPKQMQIGDEVILRVRHHPDFVVERMFLRTAPDGEQQLLEMTMADREDVCQWWQIQIKLQMPYMGYRFLLFTPDGPIWLNNSGLHLSTPTDWEDFKILPGFQHPSWIEDAVFYQIFPDRFYDANPSNNVQNGEYVYAGYPAKAKIWGETSAITSRADLVTFFGGDLEGITEKLEYLVDMGINAIYLNPIFKSFSNHRYDVVDYFNVDPHLGGNDALKELAVKCKQLGIRIMLDIVPNHCGVEHGWFKDACANQQSETAEYFTFFAHPNDYESWLGVSTLPKLNYKSQKLRGVMYANDESVFRHWLKEPYSLDGWRIDVANMLARQGPDQLDHEVGQEIRKAVKETNPEAYLLGENFFDATRQLQGEFLDGAMNYAGFMKPVLFWLNGFEMFPKGSKEPAAPAGRWSTLAFIETLKNYRAPLPWVIAQMQYNLLDSHDTPRLLTALEGNHDHIRLAIAMMFTYPGVPGVYYGDEIGMQGDGKTNRDTMVWDQMKWDHDLREFYKTLIELRKTSPALRAGGFQVLLVEQDTIAYLRDGVSDQVLLIGHRGPESRPAAPINMSLAAIPNGSIWSDLLSDLTLTVSGGLLQLPELSPGVVLLRRSR